MEKDLRLYLTIINFFENNIIPNESRELFILQLFKDLEETEENEDIIANAITLLSRYQVNDNLNENYTEIGTDMSDLSNNKREECNKILKQEFLVV